MKRLTLAFISCVLASACAATGQADPFADISVYDRSAYNQNITQCDLLAAHGSDPEAIASGVTQDGMDKPAAIDACLEAVSKDPENPRLNYQLARAYGYSGMHKESDPYRLKALNAGYPQSLFVVGYIRLEGWDGRPSDPCYGGELIRRSGEVGRLAGLVGFPHYVQTGRFDGCESFPIIDETEIKTFLKQAEVKADDYYQRILIKTLKTHFGVK